MKAFPSFLFFASMLLAGALVFGLSGCSSEPLKELRPAASQPAKNEAAKPAENPAPPVVKKDGPVSVDFDRVPLSDVVLFVTNQTGKGFILNGAGEKTVSWIEYNIPREKLFDSFSHALSSADLVLRSTTDEKTVFTIERAEDLKVPFKLDFATSNRGTFFLLGSTIYPQDSFPHQVKYDGGHWYALIPKTVADQLNATDGKPGGKI
ncbi:hypothetical protein [uncultured Desulfobulbus sp.]|uniref:hypothetical protein n=1 Tax=uncultured Desulfobulbus sp. TaxID=239745 RepID=UPI0029C78871|nr:hypothetical protein [uncultured Desulfobulbus sp.]